MIEFFLPFSLGYFACRIFQYLITSSEQTASLNNRTILKWDSDNLSWRPHREFPLDENSRYIIGEHVDARVIRIFNKSLNNGIQD